MRWPQWRRRYSSAAVAMGHNALTRTIRHAEARDLVGRNVATLVDTPKGQTGRPSKSLTLEQASALLAVTEGTRMHAYISLCLATGIRTEEARALRWEHVDFGDPVRQAARPASAAVWRSVRSNGDTKTEKSRRTLGLPQMAVEALQAHKKRQVEERLAAGGQWSDHGLVFSTRTGGALDAANVRREFKAACRAAKIGEHWTPRELRHSFVSLMSSSGVPVEEIARLAGHSNTRTTEVVYRRELRPVLTTGAEAMDRLFRSHQSVLVVHVDIVRILATKCHQPSRSSGVPLKSWRFEGNPVPPLGYEPYGASLASLSDRFRPRSDLRSMGGASPRVECRYLRGVDSSPGRLVHKFPHK